MTYCSSPNNQTAPTWPDSVEEDLVMELNAIRSEVTEIGMIQKQRCRFWNNLIPKLQEINLYQCKANKWTKQKEKRKDFNQKHSEITTNQIEKISQSLNKKTGKMVARRHKKYEVGEASNYVTRKQALHKLQLNLKVSRDSICSER